LTSPCRHGVAPSTEARTARARASSTCSRTDLTRDAPYGKLSSTAAAAAPRAWPAADTTSPVKSPGEVSPASAERPEDPTRSAKSPRISSSGGPLEE
jgi:hypothetical protein